MPETFPTLPNSKPVVRYPAEQIDQWNGIRDQYVSGATATRARRSRPKRRLIWECEVLKETEKDLIGGFISDVLEAGNDPFYLPWPVNNIWPPVIAPTLGQSAGGALGARTYYVKFTWSDAFAGQTTPSQEASLAVDANKHLTVDVRSWPRNVDHAKLYIGTASGVLYYSGRMLTSDETWTEDDTATAVNGDSAAGQKVLLVAATAGFQVGGVVRTNAGGPRQEDSIIASIQAGVSLTMVDNLAYEHLLIDADAVVTQVGLSTQAVPATENTLAETLLVHFVGEPAIPARTVGVWSLRFDLEEALP